SPPPWRCDRQWSRQTYCRRASPCHRDGYHQPSLTAGNVIGKGLDHTQGTHRVHIEYMGPGFVVDIASLLPRRAGNPGAVDEHVYGHILELPCSVPDAFGIGYVHWDDIEHAP